jgi:hypothetical protein
LNKPAFSLGQIVYHRCAPEEPGVVTGILQRPTGYSYYVTWGDRTEAAHYDIELTTEKSFKRVDEPSEPSF